MVNYFSLRWFLFYNLVMAKKEQSVDKLEATALAIMLLCCVSLLYVGIQFAVGGPWDLHASTGVALRVWVFGPLLAWGILLYLLVRKQISSISFFTFLLLLIHLLNVVSMFFVRY